MKPAAKLAAFGAVLAATFGVAAAIGAAVGPIDVTGDDHAPVSVPVASSEPAGGADHGGHG